MVQTISFFESILNASLILSGWMRFYTVQNESISSPFDKKYTVLPCKPIRVKIRIILEKGKSRWSCTRSKQHQINIYWFQICISVRDHQTPIQHSWVARRAEYQSGLSLVHKDVNRFVDPYVSQNQLLNCSELRSVSNYSGIGYTFSHEMAC